MMARVLLALLSSCLAQEIVVPLVWVQPEGRLTFNISVKVQNTWYTSISRVDLGSKVGLMLPSDSCVTTGCSSCVNDGCKCAPSDALLMPSGACPDGSVPSGSVTAKNGRSCSECKAEDVTIAFGSSKPMTLRGSTLKEVLYMNKLTNCNAAASAKTGFNGIAPFTHAIYEQAGSATLGFSIQSQQLTFGGAPPNAPAAAVPWTSSSSGGGGRQVSIIAVNGKPVTNVLAAIDSGNGAFLSYGFGSPLAAAKHFPFTVTFEGGGTLVFKSAPKVKGVATKASAYSHNVLALGFMANFDITFDDSTKMVYFADAGGVASLAIV